MTKTNERHADSHDSKESLSSAVGDLKNRILDGKDHMQDSMQKLGKKIEDRPLFSVVIALGIGYVLATLLHSKR